MNYWLRKYEIDCVVIPFIQELSEMMDNLSEDDLAKETPSLYKRHPEVKVGIRRAMYAINFVKQSEPSTPASS